MALPAPPMSLFAASSDTCSLRFATLPRSVFESSVAPLLTTTDLLAFSSASRAARQLVLVPSLWRGKVFKSFPPFISPASSLPSWCGVVQLVNTQIVSQVQHVPDVSAKLLLASLHHFPNLRHVSAFHHVSIKHAVSKPSPPPVTSLASLRHLTRITLLVYQSLDDWALKLLSSLPVLASFVAEWAQIETGSEETLAEWLAVSSKRSTKRKLAEDQDGDEKKQEEQSSKAEVKEGDADEDEEDAQFDLEQSYCVTPEDPFDPSLPQRHSPLLLFFHALASKPSFVHLKLVDNDSHPSLTPFVLDNMPVWPHLLCLSVASGSLRDYCIAPHRFPSLTSLTFPNCSDACIERLVQLPKMEELRFPEYTTTEPEDGCVRTTERGFRALSRADSLRSVQYTPPESYEETPSLAALTALFTLTNLTRLTVNALWLPEHVCVPLLTQHRFEHLRCLELIEQYISGTHFCPQSDAALLPLVKPAHLIVPGRVERQAARAAKRQDVRKERDDSDDEVEDEDIPADNATNFPALECLALPYFSYNYGNMPVTGRVSAWMKRQLRRSYEYEVAAKWEAEASTLGEAELLKSIP